MALRGIVLALEILADATLERARDAPCSRLCVGNDVPERVAECRAIVDERASSASPKQRARLAPLRAYLERVERAYAQFDRAPDRVAASMALLALTHEMRAMNPWIAGVAP